MFKKFIKWRKARKTLSHIREYNRGFDWAAGELLRKTLTPIEIEGHCWGSSDYFDKGAISATDIVCTTVILDNRSLFSCP